MVVKEMADANAGIWIAIISGMSAIAIGIANAIAMRRKNSADAAASITDAALSLYNKSETRVDDLEEKIVQLNIQVEHLTEQDDTNRQIIKSLIKSEKDLQKQLDALTADHTETKQTLNVANLNIEFLKKHMVDNGLDVPELKFRG